jgi:hypothetical protein
MIDVVGQGRKVLRKVFLEGVIIGAVAGLSGGLLLQLVEPPFVKKFVHADPTCDDPGDLAKVDLKDIKVDPSTLEKPGKASWSASAAFDGQPGTGWVPARDERTPTLTLTFLKPIDLRLMCAVNGVASNEWSYRRADRIRTAEVLSLRDARDEAAWHRAPLSTLPAGEAQNRQQVGFEEGKCSTLMFRITERYVGETVLDPVLGLVPRTGLVELAELELFEDR